jgi:hypothetical protein
MYFSKHSYKEFYGGTGQKVSHSIMICTEWKLNADIAFQWRFLEEELHISPFFNE